MIRGFSLRIQLRNAFYAASTHEVTVSMSLKFLKQEYSQVIIEQIILEQYSKCTDSQSIINKW